PPSFDVNIGNLPYCIAPHLAPWIHHDGEKTTLVSVDLDDQLCTPFDKYKVKRERDKLKPDTCAECVFDDRCTGIFEKYREFYGTGELVPVTPERLRDLDPERRLFAAHLAPAVQRLRGWTPPAPFTSVVAERRGEEIAVTLGGP